MSEDIATTVPFGNISATDIDMLGSVFYTSMSDVFLVNPVSGILVLGNGQVLDFETQ